MGDNTLNSIVQGTAGDVDQVNQYKTALTGDILPRNVQGTIEDEFADAGRSDTRFDKIYAKELIVDSVREGDRLTWFEDVFLSNGGDKSVSITELDQVYKIRIEAWGNGGNSATLDGFSAGGGGGGYAKVDLDVSIYDSIGISFTGGSTVEAIEDVITTSVLQAGNGGNGSATAPSAGVRVVEGKGGSATAESNGTILDKITEYGGNGGAFILANYASTAENGITTRGANRGGDAGANGSGFSGQTGAVVISYFAAQRLTAV